MENRVLRLFDASDPGTGKTRCRLEAFSKRRTQGGKCALVFAPKSILETAWLEDNQQYTPWLKLQCCYAENREKAFSTPADIYVTNHDATKWVAKQPPKFFAKFDTLILDESSAYKHHTSQRSKALNKIKKHFPVRVAMNGAPNTNTILDIWNQVNVLDDGKHLGASYFAFRNVVCTPVQVGPQANMLKWEDKPGVATTVADLLKDMMIRHELQRETDIPVENTVPFILTPKLAKAYKEMEDHAISFLETGEVKAINAAAVATKLLQIASGAVYDGNDNYHVIDTSRYELVADLVEARKFCVVFFIWKHQRDLLIEEFKRRKITYTVVDGEVSKNNRVTATKHFQAGFYKVMLAQPQSTAHGLTWTKGTSTIWPSPTSNLEHWVQGNHRTDRTGQKERCEVVSIVAKNTYEEHRFKMRESKYVGLAELRDYFKKGTK